MPFKDAEIRRRYNQSYYATHQGKKVPARKRRVREIVPEERKMLMQVRLPPSTMGRLRRIVNEAIAAGNYPWKTMSAAVDAILNHGFRALADDPLIGEMVANVEAGEAMMALREQRKEMQAIFSVTSSEVGELLKQRTPQMREQAAAYLQNCFERFQVLTPTPWRNWMLDKLKAQYGDLLRMNVKPIALSSKQHRVFERPAPHTGRIPLSSRSAQPELKVIRRK